MWKIVNINNKTYMVKHSKVNNNNEGIHTIYISNLIYLWEESLSDAEIVDRCQEINPLIEADSDTLIEHVIKLLISEEEGKELVLSEDNKTANLEIKSDLEGITFYYNFFLKLGDPKILFEELTLHMAVALQNLESNKNQLLELIKKKDIEINQYKIEGAQLARKLVETNPFDENDFKVHGNGSLPQELLNRTIPINSLCSNSNGITTILLENLGFDAKVLQTSIKPEINPGNQSPVKCMTSGSNSRKRRYLKGNLPGKLSYKNISDDNSSDDDKEKVVAPKVEPVIVTKKRIRRLNL